MSSSVSVTAHGDGVGEQPVGPVQSCDVTSHVRGESVHPQLNEASRHRLSLPSNLKVGDIKVFIAAETNKRRIRLCGQICWEGGIFKV